MAGVMVLGFVAAPMASADIFQLNVDYCSMLCIPGGTSGGTVTVTGNNTTSVTIDVSLNAPLDSHQTSGLDAFEFNAVSSSGLSISGLTSGFEICGGVTSGAFSSCSNHEDGSGTFLDIICLTTAASCPQTNGGPGVGGNTLAFTLTSSGAINVETLNGTSNVDFAVNVTNGTCTGLIGGGNRTGQSTASPSSGSSCASTSATSTVPEPTSILLLSTALIFAATLLKNRLAGLSKHKPVSTFTTLAGSDPLA
jgi:hypothetical protein